MIKITVEFYKKNFILIIIGKLKAPEDPIKTEVPSVNTSEIKKAQQGNEQGKAWSAYGLSIEQIMDAGDFLLDKLAILFTKCLQTCTIPSTEETLY